MATIEQFKATISRASKDQIVHAFGRIRPDINGVLANAASRNIPEENAIESMRQALIKRYPVADHRIRIEIDRIFRLESEEETERRRRETETQAAVDHVAELRSLNHKIDESNKLAKAAQKKSKWAMVIAIVAFVGGLSGLIEHFQKISDYVVKLIAPSP